MTIRETRQAGEETQEVEVTPEMIEAGVAALLSSDLRSDAYGEVITSILEAALAANQATRSAFQRRTST